MEMRKIPMIDLQLVAQFKDQQKLLDLVHRARGICIAYAQLLIMLQNLLMGFLFLCCDLLRHREQLLHREISHARTDGGNE